ncbi:MAG: hypothetical protein CVT63_01970 [Candidatus Anoxymicrobium japonicum]|uniref:FHA domain-containing protein n=1 Tax=Candidatus Anoxymicrobium japonicum TaxID=2013648 RepID=A0A2N3G769_9ACTN|nr:MAG: hypothetical protein CVT63_01970 [Candidatus Anoxymicrobium japonicum]
MNIFKDFEKKLEGLFEGIILRTFKSGVHPVELGKKLVRECEGHKTIGVSRVYVPNRYEVGLSQKDYSRFESYQATLATELENLLVSYVKERGYAVLDRPRIKLIEVERLREGEFRIEPRVEGDLPRAHEKVETRDGIIKRSSEGRPAVLELLDSGDVSPVFDLGRKVAQIGRIADNDIVLPDPNVSRVHARVEWRDGAYFVSDLESTNGTWVNEERVSGKKLQENDVIRLGSTRLIFRGAGD